MKRKKNFLFHKTTSSGTLFSVLLLLVFAMFTLMLAGTGAAVYNNSTKHLNENYTSRTAIAWLSEKVRQHNSAGDIFFSDVEGNAAVVLRETINEEVFLTYIYYCDGALCELFIREATVPVALAGSRIVELEHFEITVIPDNTCDSSVSPDSSADPDSSGTSSAFSERSGLSAASDSSETAVSPVLSVTAVSPEGNSHSMLIHYCE